MRRFQEKCVSQVALVSPSGRAMLQGYNKLPHRSTWTSTHSHLKNVRVLITQTHSEPCDLTDPRRVISKTKSSAQVLWGPMWFDAVPGTMRSHMVRFVPMQLDAVITRSHGSVTSVVRATRQVNGRRQTYPSHHTHTP